MELKYISASEKHYASACAQMLVICTCALGMLVSHLMSHFKKRMLYLHSHELLSMHVFQFHMQNKPVKTSVHVSDNFYSACDI